MHYFVYCIWPFIKRFFQHEPLRSTPIERERQDLRWEKDEDRLRERGWCSGQQEKEGPMDLYSLICNHSMQLTGLAAPLNRNQHTVTHLNTSLQQDKTWLQNLICYTIFLQYKTWYISQRFFTEYFMHLSTVVSIPWWEWSRNLHHSHFRG